MNMTLGNTIRPKAWRGSPPVIPQSWTPLFEKTTERDRLATELTQENRRLEGLQAQMPSAVASDRDARTTAARGGAKAEATAEEKLTVAIKDAALRVEALTQAVTQTDDEVDGVIHMHASAWLLEAAQEADSARDEYRAALASMMAARLHWAEAQARSRWLRGYPEVPYMPSVGHVRDLVGPNGDPMGFDKVLAALYGDADVKAQRQPGQPIAPGDQQWPGGGGGFGSGIGGGSPVTR